MLIGEAPKGILSWKTLGKQYATGTNPAFGFSLLNPLTDIRYKLMIHGYVYAGGADWNFGIQLNGDNTANKHTCTYQAFKGNASVIPVTANAVVFNIIPTVTKNDYVHILIEADFYPYGSGCSMSGRADIFDFSSGFPQIVLFNGMYNNGVLNNIAGWFGNGVTSSSLSAELMAPANDVGKEFSTI
jgi:hypothetical protein